MVVTFSSQPAKQDEKAAFGLYEPPGAATTRRTAKYKDAPHVHVPVHHVPLIAIGSGDNRPSFHPLCLCCVTGPLVVLHFTTTCCSPARVRPERERETSHGPLCLPYSREAHETGCAEPVRARFQTLRPRSTLSVGRLTTTGHGQPATTQQLPAMNTSSGEPKPMRPRLQRHTATTQPSI